MWSAECNTMNTFEERLSESLRCYQHLCDSSWWDSKYRTNLNWISRKSVSENVKKCFHPLLLCVTLVDGDKQLVPLKVQSTIIIQNTASFPFCVCPEKTVRCSHTALTKRETNRVSQVEPPTQDVKYRRFSRVPINTLVWYVTTRSHTQDKLMLGVTCMSLREHWREGCVCLAVDFKYQQAFCRITDYSFKPLQKKRTQQDDIIKRAPVRAQTMKNHVENMMEIWHFC